jgi:cardiolipin synthase
VFFSILPHKFIFKIPLSKNRKKSKNKILLNTTILCLSIGGIVSLLIYRATQPLLPNPSSPIVFYANQARHDLKLVFCEAIHSAKNALHACFYGITDRDVISLLSQKASSGIDVSIEYDRKASLSLNKFFPSSAAITPKRSKGLMHRKILIVDNAYIYLGSANLTQSSLRHHSNFVMGLYSPSLASFLLSPGTSTVSQISIKTQQAECWLLPDPQKGSLDRIISLIESATKTIRIAMFTFTHPQITHALIKAVKRGVCVSVIVDYYSGRGASKKTVELLKKEGASISLSQGQQLLHHKWAIIDENIFIMGSANWTKAAFTKNEDFLFILFWLTKPQKKFI